MSLSKPKPVLCYWNIRALGEPIRYMLKYSHVQFEDKRLSTGSENVKDIPQFIRENKNWFPIKNTLGLDFPNLPYYIDGDVKITHSVAIMRYLGRKYGLICDQNDGENSLIRQDMAETVLHDFRYNQFFMMLLNAGYNHLSQEEYNKQRLQFIATKLNPFLKELSQFFSNHEWLSGVKLTYVDFIAYEILYWIKIYSKGSLDCFPNLSQFMLRLESLPPIAAYRESNECQSWPVFSHLLPWGFYR